MSWYIAAKRPDWRRVETETPLTYANAGTGEIREHAGGFAGLVHDRDEGWELLGRIAEALGPDVLRRWEDRGPESVDLVAEVRALMADDAECAHCLSDIRRDGDFPRGADGRVFCCYECADLAGASLTAEWARRRAAEGGRPIDAERASLNDQEYDALVARREHGPLSTDGSE